MIEAAGITKEFKTYKKYPGLKGSIKSLFTRETVIKRAVSEISFSIKKGEIVGYIGANGAGKSTTIKIMSGILVPTAGLCEVAGLVPYKNRTANARNIGVVFGQRTQLWWDLPLSETFIILKEIYDVPDSDYRRRMDFFNEMLGLPEFINSTVRTLSLGQRMRADIAASLLHNPPVLYLDEPTIGLDVVVKDKIRQAIRGINAEYKTTIVLTTHDLRDIEELCSRIMIIDDGRKIYDGSLEQIKARYGNVGVLEIEPKDHDSFEKLSVAGHFPNCAVTCAFNEGRAVINFNKNKLSVAELLNYILPNTPVNDITVGETSIEDIVKQIYSEGIKS
jgi:ABC-2 type transport system ATP-binding protein